MQQEMCDSFATQMGQLELRIEGNTKRLMQDLSKELQNAMHSMSIQADRTDQLFQDFKQDVAKQMAHQMDLVLAAIQANADGTSTPKMSNTPRCPDKKQRSVQLTDPMAIDNDTHKADGSLNPTASRTITPLTGCNTSAGALK